MSWKSWVRTWVWPCPFSPRMRSYSEVRTGWKRRRRKMFVFFWCKGWEIKAGIFIFTSPSPYLVENQIFSPCPLKWIFIWMHIKISKFNFFIGFSNTFLRSGYVGNLWLGLELGLRFSLPDLLSSLESDLLGWHFPSKGALVRPQNPFL